MKNHLMMLFLACVAWLLPCVARADLVVVVSADSGITKLSREEVINIFMGRYRRLPGGATAMPLDIGGDTLEREAFYRRLVGKSLPEINAYWARLVFSGRTTPPEEMFSQREVLARVARDPVAIGYVDRASLNSKVKVVYEFPQ